MTKALPQAGPVPKGKTNVNALRAFLRMEPRGDENTSAVELLKRTPIDQLEQSVIQLKKHRSADEIRKAMVELIARAPLADFDTLKHIYLKHCGNVR
jgi:hypothetical protein